MDAKPYIVDGFGWENGRHVPLDHPVATAEACPHCRRPYYGTPGVSDDERKAVREEAIRDVLQFLASESDVRRIGWRCTLAGWLTNGGETQQQLAARLGVSGAAVSQSLKAFQATITQWLQGSGEP